MNRIVQFAEYATLPRIPGSNRLARQALDDRHESLAEILLQCALAREQALRIENRELLRQLAAWTEGAAQRLADLTPRQRQIMNMVLGGCSSKIIASDLHISQRTVENHRAAIMRKTGASSLPELARLALAAASSNKG